MNAIKRFLAAPRGSLRGVINLAEIKRVILLSLGSGTTVGLALALGKAISDHASEIFPNPAVASLATALLAMIGDLLRRQSQGIPTDHPTATKP